ncbi:uncharacterized protein LOC135962201 [Calliphora vicina]|uniref:uncharacterized protein LOC135962201 n=1 Tax=Calliphora vicina TaxID=7373 RepID=UPI00325BBDFF
MDIGRRYSKDFPENNDKLKRNRKDFIRNVNNGQKVRTTGSEIVMKYLREKDVAPWFRGTSHLHIQGADKLLNALRDDAEQRTTHRVRSCLNLIGLEPLITSKQIMFLMRLSRGNDLVFLWFLMEMHYKTPKHVHNSYSVNEQLICSAICHLDMVTTLRELDKILPSGHTSRIEMKKAGLKRKQLKESFIKRNNERISHKYVLPYFEKHPRPRHYGKRLLLEVPNFKVDMDIYSHYDNINHTVQNESNRWHSNYRFNPGKRISHLIIREVITNIFYNLEASRLWSTTIVVLCDYHKTTKALQTNLEHELKVKSRNECLKSYFMSNENKDNRAKKISELLDNAVQQQLYQFHKQTSAVRKKAESLKTITSDCKIFDVIFGDNFDGHCNNHSNVIRSVDLNNENYNLTSGKSNKTYGIQNKEYGNVHTSKNKVENILNDRKHKLKDSGYLLSKKESYLRAPDVNEFGEMYEIHNYDYDNASDTTVASSDAVFKWPLIHKPFIFDYAKIFLSKYKDNNKRCLKEMFLAALDKNTFNLSNQSSLEYDEAVRKCAKNTFDNEVKSYEVNMKDTFAAQAAENLKPLNQYPTLANYNAEDHFLMDRMLSDAFQYLRKNPKFVWAQLPDAHKIPLLREWIARRFGKEYTPRERCKSYRMSCKIFRALDKNHLEFPIPNAKQTGRNLFLNYNCRRYLDRKVQHIKNKYYCRLDSSFLDHTRVFWFAMRGYICSNGPPRKTYFAYMPSRLRDIQHFRLWKSSDYRNHKVARNLRQQKLRQDPF